MATDIATYGIAVDTRKVKTATTDLGKLGKQAGKTERATDKMAAQWRFSVLVAFSLFG